MTSAGTLSNGGGGGGRRRISIGNYMLLRYNCMRKWQHEAKPSAI